MTNTSFKPPAEGKNRIEVNFCVANDQTWPGVGNDYSADIAELARNPRGTVGSWLIRTYIELRKIGHAVTLSDKIRPNCMNVSDAFSFGRRQRINDCFVVVARSDGPLPNLANFVIHQNGLVRESDHSANIPHWPQPGLLPRDSSRGSSVSQLTFKGEPWNLDARFQSPDFIRSLAEMGVVFDLPKSDQSANSSRWFDYSKSDAVIAVRNLTEQDASIKPASKLINAWIAGLPAFLGPEPAFQELRRSALDYIEVREASEVLDELQKMKNNPRYYAAIVANGFDRAVDFSSDNIAIQWQELFDGPIKEAYLRWQGFNPVMRWLKVAGMHTRTGSSRRSHYTGIEKGKRILD